MAIDHTHGVDDRGVSIEQIPGLVTCDFVTVDEVVRQAEALTKSRYGHEEVYGDWAHLGMYIGSDPGAAFDYASSVHSLEEWTTSLRHFESFRDGVFRGVDGWGTDTSIYVRVVAFRDAGCVDYHCAWDQADELYMRVHLRLLDALGAMGRPGTMLLWTTYRHPYFEPSPVHPDHIRVSIERPDRPWIGEMWPLFPAVHALEAANLRRILEARWPI